MAIRLGRQGGRLSEDVGFEGPELGSRLAPDLVHVLLEHIEFIVERDPVLSGTWNILALRNDPPDTDTWVSEPQPSRKIRLWGSKRSTGLPPRSTGVMSESVACTRTYSRGTPSSSAAMYATMLLEPWPAVILPPLTVQL
jgi:hypothetical protein